MRSRRDAANASLHEARQRCAWRALPPPPASLRHAWVLWGWVGVVVRKLAGQARFVPQKKR